MATAVTFTDEMTSYGEKDETPIDDAEMISPAQDEVDPPPDGGYGWVVCFVRFSLHILGLC